MTPNSFHKIIVHSTCNRFSWIVPKAIAQQSIKSVTAAPAKIAESSLMSLTLVTLLKTGNIKYQPSLKQRHTQPIAKGHTLLGLTLFLRSALWLERKIDRSHGRCCMLGPTCTQFLFHSDYLNNMVQPCLHLSSMSSFVPNFCRNSISAVSLP